MKALLIVIFLISFYSCTQEPREQDVSQNDTLRLTQNEYDKLRKSLLEDTSFLSLFFDSIPANDTEAVKIKKLLNTPYESRLDSTNFTSEQIDSIFYALRISKKLRDRFDSIDSSLSDSDSLMGVTNNLIQDMEKLREEMKKTK